MFGQMVPSQGEEQARIGREAATVDKKDREVYMMISLLVEGDSNINTRFSREFVKKFLH